MNYSPFIYAHREQNIGISGKGTLDGQADADHWWPWKGATAGSTTPNQVADRTRLIDMASRGVPVAERVFGMGITSGRTSFSPISARTSSSKT
jgi:polygalacturonase